MVEFYVNDLASHTSYGPFPSWEMAHDYIGDRPLIGSSAYRITSTKPDNKYSIVPPKVRPAYWTGNLGEKDDFGDTYAEIMIDARTHSGQWANMTPKSYRLHSGVPMGTGNGQMYEKQPDGKWLKIEG